MAHPIREYVSQQSTHFLWEILKSNASMRDPYCLNLDLLDSLDFLDF